MIRPGRHLGLLAVLAALPACQPDDSAPAVSPEATPQRIVSLAPSLTELLFTLGQGERVVGVTRFCDRPPEAKHGSARFPRSKPQSFLKDVIKAQSKGPSSAVCSSGRRLLG